MAALEMCNNQNGNSLYLKIPKVAANVRCFQIVMREINEIIYAILKVLRFYNYHYFQYIYNFIRF